MKQILLTRFNIPGEWKKTKYKNNVLDNEWMNHRIKLFEYLCFPSVINQTNNNFVWHIFFDKKTNDFYIKKINDLIKNKTSIKIEFANDMIDFCLKCENLCKNYLLDDDTLLTTRIDNDDMINIRHMEIIKNTASQIIDNNKNIVIDFSYGCRIDTKYIQYENRCGGHFVSLISYKKNNELFDVFNLGDHSKIYSFGNNYKNYSILNKNNNDIIMWAEISHKYNICNHLDDDKKQQYDLQFICDNFGILKENWINFCELEKSVWNKN